MSNAPQTMQKFSQILLMVSRSSWYHYCMSKLLSPEEVEKKLHSLSLEWSVISGTELVRSYKFEDFKAAADFVARAAVKAEEAGHHPDIHLRWGEVDVVVTTHSLGGLTTKDFALAKSIESVL